MKLSEFDYDLPPERIAQRPAEPRDAARLLVHDVPGNETSHAYMRDLPRLLEAGDLVVVNDTRVRPARLYGFRSSGGAVELLLLGRCSGTRSWRAMVRPAKRLREGEVLALEGGALRARAVRRERDDRGVHSEWILEIDDVEDPGRTVEESLERFGRMPLPPYIERDPTSPREADAASYQTIFARESGAVAAPTAGLHFTEDLVARLARRGVETATVTLHVGAGTFQPVATERIEEHRMHAEAFRVGAATADALARTRARGGRVVAVGTTSARALESACDDSGTVRPASGETRLFVKPGYRFRAFDALLTNFHLPRSTLLMLVSALAGRERILALYEEAIAIGYRFYSYGDAMLLLSERPAPRRG
jgi:S-adenosylmethionine:tRNA ribosyltransferase-isomerase